MVNSATEPARTGFSNQFSVYFFATRPAFLLATLAACMLGLSGAAYSGVDIQLFTAAVTVLLALIVHAGVNVLNDYFDAVNGTDALNTERIYPFTGGSRFIQNGVLTLAQTKYFGYALLATAIVGGLWMVYYVGENLLLLGILGLFVGWAYSAAPLRLNARGVGELCVVLGFLGIIVGTDLVQRGSFSIVALLVGMPYALLVANLLYINQFPDCKADAMAGKHHLVVRLSPERAIWLYLLLAMAALLWISAVVYCGDLPGWALLAALPLLFSMRAFHLLRQWYAQPAKLLPAIKLTLASMLGHALLLSIILFWNTP